MTDLLKDYPIQLSQALIWGDMDAYQHINNTVFYRYFEDARMLLLEHVGTNQYMADFNVGPILANSHADFRAPLIYPDTITVGIKVDSIEQRKFLTHYAVYSHNLNSLAATGSGLVVYYDYNKKTSCSIPEEIKQKLIEIGDSTVSFNHS